jgi:glycosyltransferase involved in cell wall biosynthesis
VPGSGGAERGRPVRLAYVVSHPIQYQAPLLRRIAREPGIDLTVLYSSDFSTREYLDRGFGREVAWDVPLLEGYKYKILPRLPGAREVYSAKAPSRGYLSAFVKGKFDVAWVHGYHTANALQAMVAARLTGARVLVRSDSTLTDRERSRAKRALRRIFFGGLSGLVDGVLTCGTRNAEYWRAMLPGKQQFLMPYAVDNAWFAARAEEAKVRREELRAELGLEAGRPVILFAGKLVERKRCGDLVAAYGQMAEEWAAAADKDRLKDAGQVRVGRGPYLQEPVGRGPYLLIAGDGAERAGLEAEVRGMGEAAEGVKFLGFRNQGELPGLYELCDVFCLPSTREPWGLAVNEVMACGRAVVVSDVVGCAVDLVGDGENGCVFEAGDVGALAAALWRVLGKPGVAERMGAMGAERILSWDFEADVRGLRAALGSKSG